jgi:hypothetical protein
MLLDEGPLKIRKFDELEEHLIGRRSAQKVRLESRAAMRVPQNAAA